MPYLKRPAFKNTAVSCSKQVARSVFLISGLAPALAVWVIHSRSGIHFENVLSTKKGLQSTCLHWCVVDVW